MYVKFLFVFLFFIAVLTFAQPLGEKAKDLTNEKMKEDYTNSMEIMETAAGVNFLPKFAMTRIKQRRMQNAKRYQPYGRRQDNRQRVKCRQPWYYYRG